LDETIQNPKVDCKQLHNAAKENWGNQDTEMGTHTDVITLLTSSPKTLWFVQSKEKPYKCRKSIGGNDKTSPLYDVALVALGWFNKNRTKV